MLQWRRMLWIAMSMGFAYFCWAETVPLVATTTITPTQKPVAKTSEKIDEIDVEEVIVSEVEESAEDDDSDEKEEAEKEDADDIVMAEGEAKDPPEGSEIKEDQESDQPTLTIAFDENIARSLRSAIFSTLIEVGELPVAESSFRSMMGQVPTMHPNWDVVSLDEQALELACNQGTILAMDWSRMATNNSLIAEAKHRCGVGYAITATSLIYSNRYVPTGFPIGWSSLWDLNQIPGKRALPKRARDVFEIALLADGVPAKSIYQELATREGVNRALRKLSALGDEVIWWEDSSMLRQWLLDEDVIFVVASDGMLTQNVNDDFSVVRNQVLYEMQYWAIPSQSQHPDLSYTFLSFSTLPKQQIALAELLPYGPTIEMGWSLVSKKQQVRITTHPQNMKHAIRRSNAFWLQYGADLEKDFARWLQQQNK